MEFSSETEIVNCGSQVGEIKSITMRRLHEQLIHGPAALRDKSRTISARIKIFSRAFKTGKSRLAEDC